MIFRSSFFFFVVAIFTKKTREAPPSLKEAAKKSFSRAVLPLLPLPLLRGQSLLRRICCDAGRAGTEGTFVIKIRERRIEGQQ